MVVSIAVEEAQDVGSHTEYRVVTQIEGRGVRVTSWRRFRVFDGVFRKLKKRYTDLPACPAKRFSPLGLSSSAVEGRRLELQLFLKTLNQHAKAQHDMDFKELIGYHRAVSENTIKNSVAILTFKNENSVRKKYYMIMQEFRGGTNPHKERRVGVRGTQTNCDLTEQINILETKLKEALQRAVSAELELAAAKFSPPGNGVHPRTPATTTTASPLRNSFTNISFRGKNPSLCHNPNPIAVPGEDALIEAYSLAELVGISIPLCETQEETIYYCIKIETATQYWKIWKRYTGFCELKEALSEMGITSSSFPTRFSFKSSLETRRASLETWLLAVSRAAVGEHSTAKCLVADFLTPDVGRVPQGPSFGELHEMLCPFRVFE